MNAALTVYRFVLASVVATGTGAAQGVRPSYGFAGGLTVPTGDFHSDVNGDGFDTGWQGMAFFGLHLPHTALGVRLDGTYSENSANDKLKADATAIVGAPTDLKTKLLGASLDVTYEFRSLSPASVYVLSGIGFYDAKVSATSGNVTADTSETRFTWNAGAALTYSVGRATLFLEVRYFDISSPFGGSDLKYVPITAGVRFGGK